MLTAPLGQALFYFSLCVSAYESTILVLAEKVVFSAEETSGNLLKTWSHTGKEKNDQMIKGFWGLNVFPDNIMALISFCICFCSTHHKMSRRPVMIELSILSKHCTK